MYKTKQTMPFEPTYNFWTDRLDGYIWTVDPNVAEEDMRDIEPRIQHLTIAPLDPDNPVKPRIPSLEFFDRGSLETLTIKEMDVRDMPEIPPTVRVLELMRTNLMSLTELRVDWEHLHVLDLRGNLLLTNTSLIIPEGLQTLLIHGGEDVVFDIIRSPSSLDCLYIDGATVNLITGFLPKVGIQFSECAKYPKYWMDYHFISYRFTPDDVEVDVFENIQVNVPAKTVKMNECIHYTNTAYNYLMFETLGSIPTRILNPVAHKDEPIVQALFLRSNYMRRAAEFMTENTFI